MDETQTIGLAELIGRVKQDLLSADSGTPLFSIDEVKLELKVAVTKEGKAGVHVYVVEAGGSAKRDDIQTVTVTMTPLIDKPERMKLLPEDLRNDVLGLSSSVLQAKIHTTVTDGSQINY
jgi:hypothetical protein